MLPDDFEDPEMRIAELKACLERRRLQLFEFNDQWVLTAIQLEISRLEQELKEQPR